MKIFRLAHETARRLAVECVWTAPDGYVVRISEPNRSRDQNDKFHAQIDDIAKQYEFCGRKWEPEDMKRLLIDQFKRDTINDPEFAQAWKDMGIVEMAPSLDGSGVVMLGVQSRKFPKKLASGFVEYLYAFGAEAGVRWSEPRGGVPA